MLQQTSWKLWEAAFSGRDDQVLSYLKTAGIDVDYKSGYYKCSPLLAAASKGHCRCMHILLKHGSDPMSVDKDGKSALYHAAKNNQLEVIHLLKKEVQNFNHLLTMQCSSEVYYFPGTGYKAELSGLTSLHIATLECHITVVEELISCGANLYATDSKGHTSLHLIEVHKKSFATTYLEK